jgi:hypothetical protein
MRTFSITGIRLRRRVRTTVPDPATSPVPDLFHRNFTATEPGRKYMGDIRLVTDPTKVFYEGANGYQRELRYLRDKGYGWQKVGQYWEVVRLRP